MEVLKLINNFIPCSWPALPFDAVSREKLQTNNIIIVCVLPEIIENNNDIIKIVQLFN